MTPEDFYNQYSKKNILGLVETVMLKTSDGKEVEVLARIDTGATKSSMDSTLAKKIGVGPVIAEKFVRNAHGRHRRSIVEATIRIGEQTIKDKFTLADRTHLKYPVLIGKNVLEKGFLIDPNK